MKDCEFTDEDKKELLKNLKLNPNPSKNTKAFIDKLENNPSSKVKASFNDLQIPLPTI